MNWGTFRLATIGDYLELPGCDYPEWWAIRPHVIPESYPEVEDAIEDAIAMGVICIAAGGNGKIHKTGPDEEDCNPMSFPFESYPAQYNDVIAVSGTMLDGGQEIFNEDWNYGDFIDISAPGVDILVTHTDGGYTSKDGTSFSAPLVSALAGLILSEYSGSVMDITDIITSSADKIDDINHPYNANGWNEYLGYGRINAYEALNLLKSGTINANEVWTDNIYVSGDVTIANGVTLTIEPGTLVKFNNGKKLRIYGTLIAEGTASNNITFTRSGSSGSWYGIRFENSSVDANCIIKYANIEYATYGIYCNRAKPKIQNNTITNCNYGIYLYYSSPVNIETNSVTNNSTGIKGISSSPNITDNLFRDNSSSGVSFSGGAPIFYDNTFDKNSFGAYFVSGSSPKFGPTGTAGKGNNVITENSYGIYAQYYSQPFLGSHGYYPGDRIGGYNSICDNSVRDATAYFYTDIEAEYNWWGTSPVRLASYGSSINYSYALGSDPGGGSSLGKIVVITEDNSGWENEDRWAGFDPNNPDINSLSYLWLWGYYLFINDKLEEAIDVYQMLVSKFSDDNYANRALVKIYHLYRETGKDGLADYLNGLLNNSKIDENIHRILYLLLLNTSLNNKDINSSLNTIETIMYRFSDTYVEKTALYYLVLACLNDLNDIEEASRYMVLLREKYPDDELTYMAREAMGEKVSWSLNKPVIEPETADVSFPDRYALHNNYPNPFNPATTITYSLPEDAFVVLTIVDLLGREVATLLNGYQEAGKRTVLWNGKDEQGKNVPSGVYIYTISSGDFTAAKKLLLIR